MYSSARFKLTTALSVLMVLMVSLVLLGSTRSPLRAAGIQGKVSPKSRATTATSASSCGTWNVISSPNVGTSYDVLNGVVAIANNNAWAVGDYDTNAVPNPLQTLIEHWDGTSWSVISSPNVGTNTNVLNGVAAISAQNVWAVGYFISPQQTLVEHWNGTSWSVVPSPNVGTITNVLNAVTNVPGTNQLWAVGDYWDTGSSYLSLIEHWDGKKWRVIPHPNVGTDNILNGIIALSKNNVWAVGASNNSSAGVEQPLIEHWNGISWSVISNPNQGGNGYLHAVAQVPGLSRLWAVGQYNNTNTSFETLTESWDGKNWKVVSSPNPSPVGSTSVIVFLGVAALSKSSVWAIGFYQFSNGMSATQPLIEQWDGTSWNVVSSPNPGTGSALSGIARVPGTSQLWTVGETLNANGYQTFIESYC